MNHKGVTSDLQDLETCWVGMKAAAVESWHKPDTLGWTSLLDTYSLQWTMCLKGIGLTTGKKGWIINESDFKHASKKKDYHFNFNISLLMEIRISMVQLLSSNARLPASSYRWGNKAGRQGLLGVVQWCGTGRPVPSPLFCAAASSECAWQHVPSKVEAGEGGGRGCKFQRMYTWQEWQHTWAK